MIRIHTRVPIVDPGRVTAELVAALKPRRAALWLAVHCNHAARIDRRGARGLARLADAGIPLMGQTVLLRGVNDDVATLRQLMRALVVDAGQAVLPASSRSGARHRRISACRSATARL